MNTLEQTKLYGLYTEPQTLKATNQNVTDTFAAIGSAINTAGAKFITFFISVTRNNSSNIRFKIVSNRTASGTDNYNDLIETAGASDIKIENKYYELNVDADNKFKLKVQLDGSTPYLTLQTCAGTVGSPTAAVITSVYYILSNI